MKKILSVILAALILFSVSSVSLTAFAQTCSCGITPVVYVKGYRHPQMKNEDGTMTPLLENDMDIVSNLVEAALPLAAKAIVTGDWNEYCDTAYEILKPLYADAQPRPDGTVKENTGICDDFEDTEFWSWNENTINGNYHRYTNYEYRYIFDFRLSMIENAGDLNNYIQAVKAKTGHDKVVLVGRCGGTNLIAAYLYKYAEANDFADIEKVIMVSSNVNGADFMEALLSGTVVLEHDAVYRYLKYNESIDELVSDPSINAFITATIDMLQASGFGLDAICNMAQSIYDKVKDRFFARLLKEYYGITPAYTSFVYDHYEEFKNYIFQEEGDLQKYAAIIADADEYHYEAQMKFEDRLLTMREAGVEIDNIVFYGDQTYPLTETALLTSDEVASVLDQSMGAKASELDSTLSSSYIAAREAEGKGKYISADKQIDASTCLLPETTWFVKNAHHEFGAGLAGFVYYLEHTKNVTVETSAAYPQFLNRSSSDVYVPLQDENAEDTDWAKYDEEAKEGTSNFIEIVVEFLRNLILKVIGFIQGIISHAKA